MASACLPTPSSLATLVQYAAALTAHLARAALMRARAPFQPPHPWLPVSNEQVARACIAVLRLPFLTPSSSSAGSRFRAEIIPWCRIKSCRWRRSGSRIGSWASCGQWSRDRSWGRCRSHSRRWRRAVHASVPPAFQPSPPVYEVAKHSRAIPSYSLCQRSSRRSQASHRGAPRCEAKGRGRRGVGRRRGCWARCGRWRRVSRRRRRRSPSR